MKKLQKCANRAQGQQEMYTLAIGRFDLPGDAGFPLNAVYAKPGSPGEAGIVYILIHMVYLFNKLNYLV